MSLRVRNSKKSRCRKIERPFFVRRRQIADSKHSSEINGNEFIGVILYSKMHDSILKVYYYTLNCYYYIHTDVDPHHHHLS